MDHGLCHEQTTVNSRPLMDMDGCAVKHMAQVKVIGAFEYVLRIANNRLKKRNRIIYLFDRASPAGVTKALSHARQVGASTAR